MDEIGVLDKLKNLILLKTGIRTITPADCKIISIEISKKLNKRVSETTIKRLFGFAAASHKFSKFTLLTLAEYVQDEELNMGPMNQKWEQESLCKWEEIHEKASKITQHTLSSIKYRSGIPYELTVSRKFAEYDLDDFINSDYSFTSFICHAGYGKTILLTHLADRIINDKTGIYKDSTVLFLKINYILESEKPVLILEDLLKAQLGIHPKESLVEYADHHYDSTGGKFIIFLDGFSELITDRASLFESIVNFICSLEDGKSIKVVISMRPTNWSKFHEYIRQSAYLKTKWFKGSYFDSDSVSNVPQLTDQEVDLVLSKDKSIDINRINLNLKTQLRYPFQIQFYLQLREEDPDFGYATNITVFELASRYVIEKIYKTIDYTVTLL
ncbi:MAG: NACHT domain-containing protein [Chryseobacterium sp.]|nr:MAG: NACHT domain-containing protein [Chryseobacterium sp.]